MEGLLWTGPTPSRYSYSYQTIHQETCNPKIRLHIKKTLKIKFSLGVCMNTSAWDQGIISFAVWTQLVLTPLKQSNCTGLYCQANGGQWRSDLGGKLWDGGDKTSRATGRNSLQFTVPDTQFYTIHCQPVKRTALSGRGDGPPPVPDNPSGRIVLPLLVKTTVLLNELARNVLSTPNENIIH